MYRILEENLLCRFSGAVMKFRQVLKAMAGLVIFMIATGVYLIMSMEQAENAPFESATITGDRVVSYSSGQPYSIRTTIEVRYPSPIDEDSSARVYASIEQTQANAAELGTLAPKLDALETPVTLKLTSPAFDFADDDLAREISKGARLPAEVRWAPIPKKAGTWDLLLRISGATGQDQSNVLNVAINGEQTKVSATNDVVLTVEVNKLTGISAQTYKWAAALLAIVGVIIGTDAFTGLISAILNRLRKRTVKREPESHVPGSTA